ncbi:MAG: sugar transferase [Chloroflexi bacterium]|nr:sugar transferase [Chloroflexota bacterium]
MRRKNSANFTLYLVACDLALTLVALFLATQFRLFLPLGQALTERLVQLPPTIYAMALIIWLVVFLLLSVYDDQKNVRAVDEFQRLVVGVGVSVLVFAGALYLSYREVSRLLFAYFAVLDLVALLSFRSLLRLAIRLAGERQRGEERVLIIGAGKVGLALAQRVGLRRWAGLELVGYLDDDPEKLDQVYWGAPVLGTLAQAAQVVHTHAVDQLVVALPLRAHEQLAQLVLDVGQFPVRVRVVPDVFDLAFFRATIEDFDGMPLIGLRDPAIDGFNRLVKRAFDLLGASLLLLLISPLMLIIALAVKLDSPNGPVLFRQKRVGENGEIFRMYKFRSMVPDAEQLQHEVNQYTEDGHVIHKVADDPRVTRVGRFIRRWSLDELPQFFNVIKGEMSLVGPRPELPWLVEQYESWQRKRFAVPPGITGWWQISGRSERMMHLHTEDDLYYIQNYSPLLDLQILWRTLGAVVKRSGAY